MSGCNDFEAVLVRSRNKFPGNNIDMDEIFPEIATPPYVQLNLLASAVTFDNLALFLSSILSIILFAWEANIFLVDFNSGDPVILSISFIKSFSAKPYNFAIWRAFSSSVLSSLVMVSNRCPIIPDFSSIFVWDARKLLDLFLKAQCGCHEILFKKLIVKEQKFTSRSLQ